MKKSILVTDGAGFPGSHLCERLLSEGYDKIFFTFSVTRIFGFIVMNVTFPLYVEVDQIYNLACSASPIYSLVIPD